MATSPKAKIKLPESFRHMMNLVDARTAVISELLDSNDFRDPEVTRYQIKAELVNISNYAAMAQEILDDERDSLMLWGN